MYRNILNESYNFSNNRVISSFAMFGKLEIFIDSDCPAAYTIQYKGRYMTGGIHYGLKEVGVISNNK